MFVFICVESKVIFTRGFFLVLRSTEALLKKSILGLLAGLCPSMKDGRLVELEGIPIGKSENLGVVGAKERT